MVDFERIDVFSVAMPEVPGHHPKLLTLVSSFLQKTNMLLVTVTASLVSGKQSCSSLVSPVQRFSELKTINSPGLDQRHAAS